MQSESLKILFSPEQIQDRIKLLAVEIDKEYQNKSEGIVVVSVLKGAFMFTADLLKHLQVPVQLEFVRISSYGSNKISSGKIEAPILLLPDLSGKDILIIEDIVDSGRTVLFLKDYIKDQYKPKSLKIASLLSKKSRREVTIDPDYVGFEVNDYFLVGYGLDHAEQYRNLPYLAICD